MTTRASRGQTGRQRGRGAGALKEQQATKRAPEGLLEIPSTIAVNQLASLMGLNPIEVIKQLMRNGVMASINQVVDYDTAAVVAADFGLKSKPLAEPAEDLPGSLTITPEEEDPSQLVSRPPVVTILGHVDHGKTTLLDAIRESNLTAGEVGGITQHIGAYQVTYKGQFITFIDTPGHEAFTAMRARGARVTDIAVLVVAADDGVMPQTVEALNHAKAAGVPIVVAINKMDRPEADVERVKRQLSEHGLLIEEWGGDVIAVPISARERQGIDELLENILVVAEVAELKANPDRLVIGTVVEAKLDKGKGPVATVLIQTGSLRVGENVVVGDTRGRVKAMIADTGRRVKVAWPSMPVEVLGLSELPQPGDTLMAVLDEKTAREVVEQRQKEQERRTSRAVTLEEVVASIESGSVKELSLIVKVDVQGSVDAIRNALERLSTEKAKVKIIHAGSGSITEGDVLLAVASKAIIIGFNSRPEMGARRVADQEGVDIRFYDVIYRLTEDIQGALQGLLQPAFRDIVEGRAEVRAIFTVGRRQKVAGFYVTEGRMTRNSLIKVLRKGQEVFEGPMSSLRHFKDDVRELAAGYEGGMSLEGFDDFQEGDILEAHRRERAGS